MRWLLDPGRAVHSAADYFSSVAVFWIALVAWFGIGHALFRGGFFWIDRWLEALVFTPLATPIAHWGTAWLVRALARLGGNRQMSLSTAGRLGLLAYCHVALPSLALTVFSTFTTEAPQNHRLHVVPELQWLQEALNNLPLAHLPLPATWQAWSACVLGVAALLILCRAVVLAGRGAPGFSAARTRWLFLGIPGGLLLLIAMAWVTLRPIPLPRATGQVRVTPVGIFLDIEDWPMLVEDQRIVISLGLPGATMVVENVAGTDTRALLAATRVAASRMCTNLQWGETVETDRLIGCRATGDLDGEPMSAWVAADSRAGANATKTYSLLLPTRAWSVSRFQTHVRLMMNDIPFALFLQASESPAGGAGK